MMQRKIVVNFQEGFKVTPWRVVELHNLTRLEAGENPFVTIGTKWEDDDFIEVLGNVCKGEGIELVIQLARPR